MACTIEVLFTPAESRALRARDLSKTVGVVFDVLRATSTFVTALANGAEAIIPVEDISSALEWRRRRPEVLLAGERRGVRIGANLTEGVEFDFGNSPREYTPDRVQGRTIVSTTTNGTHALLACSGARRVLLGSLLNLNAVVAAILAEDPEQLVLVCAGTGEGVALEDVLAAGAVCAALPATANGCELADSAVAAQQLYSACQSDLESAISQSRNARRLLGNPDLRADVEFCLRVNTVNIGAEFSSADGVVKALH